MRESSDQEGMSDVVRQVKVHHSGLLSLHVSILYLHTRPYYPMSSNKCHHRYTSRLVSEVDVEYKPLGTTKGERPFSELISFHFLWIFMFCVGKFTLCGEASARGEDESADTLPLRHPLI